MDKQNRDAVLLYRNAQAIIALWNLSSKKSNPAAIVPTQKYVGSKFSHLTFFRRITLFKSSSQFTSGMMIISILILNNIKPSVFGFSLKKKSSFYKSYWQKGAKIKKPVHDLENENELLKKFITLKKITYYN